MSFSICSSAAIYSLCGVSVHVDMTVSNQMDEAELDCVL